MGINSKVVLICRYGHDDEHLKHLYYWLGKMVPKVKSMGLRVTDLHDESFNKKNVVNELIKNEPFLVIFCGHGDDDKILGYKDMDVINMCNEDKHFEGKTVVAFSCKTISVLGKSALKKKCTNYCGWVGKLIIPSNGCDNAEDDECSKPVIDALLQVPLDIMKGENIKKAYEKCQEALLTIVDEWSEGTKFISPSNILNGTRERFSLIYSTDNAATGKVAI